MFLCFIKVTGMGISVNVALIWIRILNKNRIRPFENWIHFLLSRTTGFNIMLINIINRVLNWGLGADRYILSESEVS